MSNVSMYYQWSIIVIGSFEIEFRTIQKIHPLPWPLSGLRNVVLSAQLGFLFGSSVCINLKCQQQPCQFLRNVCTNCIGQAKIIIITHVYFAIMLLEFRIRFVIIYMFKCINCLIHLILVIKWSNRRYFNFDLKVSLGFRPGTLPLHHCYASRWTVLT